MIANLALYFAINTLFARTSTASAGPVSVLIPDLTTVRPVPLAITTVACVLLFAVRWPVLRTLGVCAVLGLIAGLVGLPVR